MYNNISSPTKHMIDAKKSKMQKTAAIGDKLMMKPPSHSLSIFRENLLSPFLLIAFIFSTTIIYTSDFCYISRLYDHNNQDPANHTILAVEKTRVKLPFAIGEGNEDCDIFSGRWVRDHSPPPYEEWECPYIGGQLTCLEHGRPEEDYRHWRWQPHGCSVPSFNATLMLEALRGKRMMFVGDSLNRGQFTSLICLLHRVVPQHAKSMETIDSLTVFTAKDYNARIEFYWAPFLLESNSDDPVKHSVTNRIIRNGTVDKHGIHWKEADIIVFNTYIWWVEGVRILGGSFDGEVKDIIKISKEEGYRIAMKMLVKWINKNIDPKKKRIFFAGMSATHQGSFKWGGAPKGNCYNETTMIEDPAHIGVETSLLPIIPQELGKSVVPITFLNITQLTSPRKDAHNSIYKAYHWGSLTEKQLENPSKYADCIHWCLPGVQDVWNELLFAKLFYP